MAWTYEQKFNDLNNGDLNGQDSWSAHLAFDVETSVKYEGAKALSFLLASENEYANRNIDAISQGIVYVALMNDGIVSGNWAAFRLRTGTTRCISVGLKATSSSGGHISDNNDNNMGPISEGWTYLKGQWYVLAVEFDDSAQPDKFRLKFHDGVAWSAWSAWKNCNNSYVTLDNILLEGYVADGAHYVYFDSISPNDPTPVLANPNFLMLM